MFSTISLAPPLSGPGHKWPTRTRCAQQLPRSIAVLAVDHSRCRTGFAPAPLAVAHDQMMVDRLPGTIVAQSGEPAVDRVPERKGIWHQPPRRMWQMALITSRIRLARLRPQLALCGGWPTRHPLGRFHTVAPPGYDAAEWSRSTSLAHPVFAKSTINDLPRLPSPAAIIPEPFRDGLLGGR